MVKPYHTYVRSEYRSRLLWSPAAYLFRNETEVKFTNVTKQDQKKFGVEIDVVGETSLKNGVQIVVVGGLNCNETSRLNVQEPRFKKEKKNEES